MATKPDRSKTPKRQESGPEDTAISSLSKTDRKKLDIDAWEPSLLRELLTAQNRLHKRD